MEEKQSGAASAPANGSSGSGSSGGASSGTAHRTLMGVLAYVGPLVIISYITARDDASVKFHIKQGLVLLVIEGALWVVSSLFWFLFPVWQIINVIAIILAVLGIVHAVKGEERALPFVGSYSKYFNF